MAEWCPATWRVPTLLLLLGVGLAANALPFEIPDSLGPFLRFSGVDGDTYTISILAAAKGSNVLDCLDLALPSGLDASSGAELLSSSPELLDSYDDYQFIRWTVSLTLGDQEIDVAYKISSTCTDVLLADQTTTSYRFTVPGKAQAWSWAYFSCNGFATLTGNPATGIRPLWGDLMEQHSTTRKLHLLAGNGDQLYNDPFFESHPDIMAAALNATNTDAVTNFQWTPELEQHTNDWYFSSYAHRWMLDAPEYQRALASVPYTMSWDDHDAFNGFGSQIDVVRESPFYITITETARRFYLLFQHHSTADNLMPDLAFNGASAALSVVARLGPTTAILAPDERSERTPRSVLSETAYNNIKSRLDALPDGVKHLVVLSAQPLVFPLHNKLDLALKETARVGIVTWPDLQDRFQDLSQQALIKSALAAAGQSPRFLFGAPDLSDLVDQWDSMHHKEELQTFIALLQGWAEPRGARVTFLSGDSHFAYAAQLSSTPATSGAEATPAINDPKYMFAAVSSAIGNVVPTLVAKLVGLSSVGFAETLNITGTGDVTATMAPVFRGVQRLPVLSTYVAPRRNYLLVDEAGEAGYLQLTWRLEAYVNTTVLQPAVKTVGVPPFVASSSPLATP